MIEEDAKGALGYAAGDGGGGKEAEMFWKEDIAERSERPSGLSLLFHSVKSGGAHTAVEEEKEPPGMNPSRGQRGGAAEGDRSGSNITTGHQKSHSVSSTGSMRKCVSLELHRSRSSSVSLSGKPVTCADYQSIMDSPAMSFLAGFAQPKCDQPLIVETGDVAGDYIFGDVVGRGLTSECRIAYSKDNRRGSKFAAKLVNSRTDEFEKEIELQSGLSHPNILPVVDFFSVGPVLVAVFPFAEQGTLRDVLLNQVLSEKQCQKLFSQLVDAVAYLHEQDIAHCDIKLDNILVTGDGMIYLADFGLASMFCNRKKGEECGCDENPHVVCAKRAASGNNGSASEDEMDHHCKGTLAYCPPEQLDRKVLKAALEKSSLPVLLKKADSWALGVVLYAMIEGRLPFSDSFAPKLQLNICTCRYDPPQNAPDSLRDLISKILNTDPVARFDVSDILNHRWMSIL